MWKRTLPPCPTRSLTSALFHLDQVETKIEVDLQENNEHGNKGHLPKPTIQTFWPLQEDEDVVPLKMIEKERSIFFVCLGRGEGDKRKEKKNLGKGSTRRVLSSGNGVKNTRTGFGGIFRPRGKDRVKILRNKPISVEKSEKEGEWEMGKSRESNPSVLTPTTFKSKGRRAARVPE